MTTTPWADRYYASGDGLRLHYRDYAPAAPGRLPVLCIAGLTRNSRDFETLAPRIARTRRVLCADLRGRGASQHDPRWQNYHPAVTSRTSRCCWRMRACPASWCWVRRSAASCRC